MSSLKNKNIIVTGASSGVGKAISLELASHGANLCLVGRNKNNLETVLENVNIGSPHSNIYIADFNSDEDIQKLRSSIQEDYEHIDILIHSATLFNMGTIEESPIEGFDRQYKVNVRAPYLLTQLFLPSIKLHRGAIVFVNSTVGTSAKTNLSQYSATKHALKAVADSLREEVNSDGVRVFTIYIGRTATPMQVKMHAIEGKPYSSEKLLKPEDIARTIVHSLALPHTAEITDITIRPSIK